MQLSFDLVKVLNHCFGAVLTRSQRRFLVRLLYDMLKYFDHVLRLWLARCNFQNELFVTTPFPLLQALRCCFGVARIQCDLRCEVLEVGLVKLALNSSQRLVCVF